MKSKSTYPILLGCLLAAGAFVSNANAQAQPKHRYSFNDGGGDSVTVTDSVGGQNGTLINTTGNSAFADGQLTLGNDGSQGSNVSPITGDYVDLPNGMISDLVGVGGVTAFTMEGWYTWRGAGDWQRFYDVGRSLGGEDMSDRADNQPNFFIAVKAGGFAGSRAAWTGRGIGENSLSSSNGADSATGVPHHVAFVWDEANTSARYYVDGSLIGENTATAMTVQNDFAGDDVNNWLGRSNWPDDLFVGSFDEFRVYDTALTEDEVLANIGNGPDALDGPGLGSLVSIESTLAQTELLIGTSATINTVADYENFAGRNISNTSGVTYSSSNGAVATVSATGEVAGLSAGDVTITIEFSGLSSTVVLTVRPPVPTASALKHRYSFTDGGGDSVTLTDSVSGSNGTLINRTGGSVFSDGQLTLGNDGSQSSNAGTGDYVDLANGILTDMINDEGVTTFSIETWATWNGTGNWQRIWDMGISLGGEDASPSADLRAQMFLTPSAGGTNNPRTAWRPELGGETALNAAGPVGIGEMHHYVFTWDEPNRTSRFYLDGILEQENTGLTMTLQNDFIGDDVSTPEVEDAPLDVNNWLGRSQWNDTLFVGSFDEFRIYTGVLSPLQAVVNSSTGPDTIVDDLGDVQSIEVQLESNTAVAGGAPIGIAILTDFEAVQDIDLAGTGFATLSSSDESVAMFVGGQLAPVGPGTAMISATVDGQSSSSQLTVTASGLTSVLDHRFSFDGNLDDSVGGLNDGVLGGGAVFENGGVTLPGGATDAGYIDLPEFMFSDYYFQATDLVSLTFEIFGTWNGGAPWQRMIDLGDNDGTNGRSFLAVSPSDGGGLLRMLFNNAVDPEINLTGPGLVAGEPFFVAVVFDPVSRVLRLHRNGELVAIQPFPDSFDFSVDFVSLVVNDENEWLGRSNFTADSGFAGSITEYRIWQGALLNADIALHNACGPDELECEIVGPTDPLPMSVALTAEGFLVVSWPSEGAGLKLQLTAVLGPDADWQDVDATPVTEGDTTSVTISDLTGAGYFRLITQ